VSINRSNSAYQASVMLIEYDPWLTCNNPKNSTIAELPRITVRSDQSTQARRDRIEDACLLGDWVAVSLVILSHQFPLFIESRSECSCIEFLDYHFGIESIDNFLRIEGRYYFLSIKVSRNLAVSTSGFLFDC